MRRVIGALTVAVGVALVGQRADACSVGGNVELTMQQTGIGDPPGPIGEVTYTTHRGVGPRRSGCSGGEMGTSCDDMGSVILHFKPAADPDSDAQSVGYRLLFAGVLPSGLDVPVRPIVSDGELFLHFVDGATDEQEKIDFSLTITPVDANGNEGPKSPLVHVTDAGRDTGGCSVHTGRSGTLLVPMTIVVLALLRRRFADR
jgi:hypothetical protein